MLELTDGQIHAQFPKLFSGKLGCLKGVCIKLDVDTSVKPSRQPQRPVAFHLRDVVAKELSEQIECGILERVDQNSGPTPWVSNMVIIPKDKPVDDQGRPAPHKSVRITCDSKAVNKAILRTRYPGKSIDDLVVQVNGSVVFSVIDIMKAFHQLELHPDSRYLTTITTHVGLLRYLRLHMGISCASEVFTEEIRKLLLDLDNCLNMTDDILIYGKTRREHHYSLLKVLSRLELSGLTLNKAKCKFYQKKVVFFGMKFSEKGIGPTEDRCRALWDASAPENVKDLRSFLCSVLYSSRFIKDLCKLSEPLWKLLRSGEVWRWTEFEEKAFNQVKKSISEKAMAYFNKDWSTELEVDAGPEGLGAVLKQFNPENDNERSIVTFKSRLLTADERKLSQVEKEALSAVWGAEANWLYLMGKKFVLITDNRAVQLIFSNTAAKPPARIERLALRLSQFDFTVEHRPGKDNMADYYSRHSTKSKSPAFLQEVQAAQETERYVNWVAMSAIPRAITMDMLVAETKQDDEIQELIGHINRGSKARQLPKSLEVYRRVYDELSVTCSGVVLRGARVLVPSGLRKRTLELAHVGHQGVVKTKLLIRARVWYPGIDQQVEEMMKWCLACQANLGKQELEPVKPTSMPAGPWLEVSADFYGPMDTGAYWFVNVCDYSRYIFVDEVKSVAMDYVQPVLERLFSMFGTPSIYKTDNGAPFMSHRFGEFAAEWGFRHRKVTPLWPRANGGAESVMPKLSKVVRTCQVTGSCRKKSLQEFLRSYRATPHTVTRVPPAMLFLGFSRLSGIPMLDGTRAEVEKLHELAVVNDRASKKKAAKYWDSAHKAKESMLEVGDLVLYKWARTRKSMPLWDPVMYEVVARKGSMVTAARHGHTVTTNSSFFKFWSTGEQTEQPAALGERKFDNKKTESEQLAVQEVNGEVKQVVFRAVEQVASQMAEDYARADEMLVEQPVNNTPVEEVVEPAQSVVLESRGKVGRPTKSEQAKRDASKAEADKAKALSNPPLRKSPRNLF